jgi:uncharacterized membrane protein
MAKDTADAAREMLTRAVHDLTQSIGTSDGKRSSQKSNPLAGAGGVAVGAGLAALAPIAAKGAVHAVRRRMVGEAGKAPGRATRAVAGEGGLVDRATKGLGDVVGDKVRQTVEDAGGVGGVAQQVGKGVLSSFTGSGGGGAGGGGGQGAPGVGKGRRMPVQQAIDIAVPIETCYNQWTQFEEWPQFMHRVTRVTQDDECTVSFATKIWGKTKEFKADIETQRPDERIKWSVESGITHTGVVTFHEIGPRLTRVELTFDVAPGSLIEKAARGMRHVKRAARADLHRFKAYIEMQELETGAWRGVIEDGELVEEHDPEYDEERDYADAPAATSEEEPEEDEEPEDEEPEASAEDEEDEDQERAEPRAGRERHAPAERRQSAPRRREGGDSARRAGGGRRRPAASPGNR